MEADPLNARWFVIRAEQFSKQMRYDQEMADYYRAIELSKKDGLWWLSDAVKSISDRKDLDHALAILARAMEIDPLNARWVLQRAELYSKQSRFDEANADYVRVLDLDVSQGVLQITAAADRLFEQKTYDPGISLLTRALEVRPDDIDLLLARTKLYRANAQTKAAESDATRVVDLCSNLLLAKPSDVNAYFNRASAYAFKESWELAIADAKHGLSLLTTAEELEEKGSNLDAISTAHDAKQFQLVATWYKELADQVQKLEVAETGKAGKETAAALGSLSYHLLFVKQYKEALAAADQALVLTPDRKWISVNRAHALLFLGRGDEAKSLFAALWKERLSEYSPPLGDSIIDDFNELEKAGLSHPQISEIKALHPAAAL
jgi:tetratricopeptide (TPR) repeat protein